MKTITSSSGFTLIELLVVIAIIAILAALTLPTLPQIKKKFQAVETNGFVWPSTSAQP